MKIIDHGLFAVVVFLPGNVHSLGHAANIRPAGREGVE